MKCVDEKLSYLNEVLQVKCVKTVSSRCFGWNCKYWYTCKTIKEKRESAPEHIKEGILKISIQRL